MGMTWGQLGGSLTTAAVSNRVPLTGHFELTARCNLCCKMCYVCRKVNDNEAIDQELSAGDWIQLAREARDAGMLYLLITGGEVFLRQDFREIYEEISKMGFIITINTNATMITPEIAKWLGRIPPSLISITLYGASSETYEKICGDASAYERALRGINLLISEGIKFEIKTTIVRGNINDFTKLKEFAEKCGVRFGIVSYISPRREGVNTYPEAERLSPKDLVRFERKIEYDSKKNKKLPSNNNELGKNDKNLLKKNEDHPFRCTCGKSNFWITWDGNMVPCALSDKPSISVVQSKFVEVWENFQELCYNVPVCGECRECINKEICLTCPARLKNETGCYDIPAPYLCELVKEAREFDKEDCALSI